MGMLLENPIPFRGGVRLSPNKAQSLEPALQAAQLPTILTIPMRQHIGTAASPVVSVGDHVLKGQEIACYKSFITAPIHASSSGTVVDISTRPVPTPSGKEEPCIVIETDGKEEWLPHEGSSEDLYQLSPSQIHDIIYAAGIVGLGGAGFPTAVKMLPGLHFDIHLLVLNAAECEPYISCDEALIRVKAREIIAGLEIIRHAVQAEECVIGIEDNKTEAIAAFKKEIENIGETSINLVPLPAIYPTGSESQLIKSLTGLEVPSQGLPLDMGIVCYNVGTVYAVYHAVIQGEPLLSRVVTVTGNAIEQPRNLEVLIGTPIKELIEQCGGYRCDPDQLLIGGPMMGFMLHDVESPVIKTTNCIIAATTEEMPPSQPALPCIRCGDCASACPVDLLPQQLYWFARAQDQDRLREFKLFDCIECGCCSYVCPSRIPLVQYYQTAKAEIWQQERQLLESDNSRQRYAAHQARLNREKEESIMEKEQTKRKGSIKAEIDAAVKREKAKRKERNVDINHKDD